MTQQQANQIIEEELARLHRPDDYPVTGFVWKLVLPHQDAWHALPR